MDKEHRDWMSWVMGAAGLYALAWGLAMVAAPVAVGNAIQVPGGVQAPLIQALGWLVAVLGLGYLLSAPNPFKNWPVVAMGFIAKAGAFAGTLLAYLNGQAGLVPLATSVANDLLWLAPFGWILWSARSAAINRRRAAAPEILRMALHRKTNYGVTLDELSRMSPVLLVFLRHAGCTFCREALADLAARKPEIEENGTRLVLVHMGSEQHGSRFFQKYGLESVPQISDPKKSLYRAFGLRRGTFGDLFGPKVWLRGFEAGILGRHGVGRLVGDGFQMPGAFLLFHGEVVRSYRHQSAADRPDYMALVTGRVQVAQQVRR